MKTKKKFSLGVKIASILSCVAVLSVGFASWLIVNVPTETNNQIGSFEVYEVVDNSVALTYDWGNDGVDDKDGDGAYTSAATAAAKITFGKPSGATNAGWLQAGNDVQNEKLTATVKVTIDNFTQLQSFSVTLTPPTISSTLITSSVSYKNAQGTSVDTNSDGALNATELAAVNGVVVVELTFAWGSAFTPADAQAPVNPFTYYNGQTYSADLATEANTNLTAINTALSGKTYSVTFTCQ